MKRRFGEVLLGIFLLSIGFTALANNAALAMFLVSAGLILFAVQYGRSASQMPPPGIRRPREDRRSREERRPSASDWWERQRSEREERSEADKLREREALRQAWELRQARLSRDERPTPPRPAPARAPVSEELSPREGVYRHAREAARRAGIDPDHTYVLSTDVGVLVYHGDDAPVIQRTTALNETAEYIQPFVSLRLPTEAEGRVKFELVDGQGNRRFVHEEFYHLQSGANLLTPPSRMRVGDLDNAQEKWRLRVYAENMLITEHEITWEIASTSVVRRHLMEDGEISTESAAEMRHLMAEQKLTSMSLDDLLAYQDDEPGSKQARG